MYVCILRMNFISFICTPLFLKQANVPHCSCHETQASCSQMSAIAICGSLWRRLAFLYWPSWACFLDFWKTKNLPGCLSTSTHFFDVAFHQGGEIFRFFFFFGNAKFLDIFAYVPHKNWACFPALGDHLFIRVGLGVDQPPHFSKGPRARCCSILVPVMSFGETTVNSTSNPKLLICICYLLTSHESKRDYFFTCSQKGADWKFEQVYDASLASLCELFWDGENVTFWKG